MLKLRTILLSDKLYILILVIVLIISSIRLIIPKKSTINAKTKYVEGIIIDYKINDDKIIITVKNNEKYLIYCNDFNQLKKIKVGIKIKAYGSLNQPSKQTNINTFDYKKYLYNKNIFYIVTAKKIEIINSKINTYYKIKNYLLKKTKINPYLRAFILGDKSLIDKKVLESFQENGISHLFAISGMHISLLSAIILNTLKKIKIKENSRYFYTSIFLILYLSQIGLSPSALRGVLFFILFSINKIYYFYIKPFNIALVVFCITLLINPYFIYDIGFQFSFSISIALILMSKKITGNYLQKLFKVSLISFFTSTPISLYNYYQLNLLSIIYNLFFVPLVSLIIFPMSLIALVLPINPIYNILTSLLEKISLTLGNINIGKIIFKKLNIYFYLIYYLVLILIYIYRDKKIKRLITIYIGIIIIHFFIPNIYKETYVIMLDVGQGDSTIIYSNNTCIVIDTGGKVSNKNENSTISKQIIIPILKSLGIKKIDYLILTHGDFDHMGEAINLVENYKVKTIVLNCGSYNYLEKRFLKILDEKMINYYSCIEKIDIGKNSLQILNTWEYNDENNNSNVIYFNLNDYKFLFMGDAGIEKEKDILEKYELNEIDFLKVGHHGSDTSSSIEFIEAINPKYSLISVGKNNRYGHPKDEVLETLKNSKVYRTDLDGSIEIKLNKNGYKIKTCPP